MLRSVPRASVSSSTLLPRCIQTPPRFLKPAAALIQNNTHQQTRSASAHAISNPTLAGIEKRWEAMPPQEQADLWMALRDRMKVDWHELTLQEKKAAYWIAFGPHGPRSLPPPGEGWRIFNLTMLGVGVSFVLFMLVRSQARAPPETMTKEYQEMTNEYLKSQNTEPISGISMEGYTGKGQENEYDDEDYDVDIYDVDNCDMDDYGVNVYGVDNCGVDDCDCGVDDCGVDDYDVDNKVDEQDEPRTQNTRSYITYRPSDKDCRVQIAR
ncbi:Cytochrome c oxidase subunit 5A [Ptychographa xylographoides]|nr:Cytochrome c oxidase subunit 5A [Ptychographa xylographoides]